MCISCPVALSCSTYHNTRFLLFLQTHCPWTRGQALPKRSSITMSRQTLVVIVVVISLTLLLSAVVVLEVRNKRRHKDLLGRVKPPLGDPDTTIVVVAIKVIPCVRYR